MKDLEAAHLSVTWHESGLSGGALSNLVGPSPSWSMRRKNNGRSDRRTPPDSLGQPKTSLTGSVEEEGFMFNRDDLRVEGLILSLL